MRADSLYPLTLTVLHVWTCCLISPADGHYAVVAPIVWWCHLSDVQQSVTGRSRLLDPCLEHSAGGDNDVAGALYLPSTT